MRGVTTQTAEELNFLLNGKDGKADKMVSVVQYFKGEWEQIADGCCSKLS